MATNDDLFEGCLTEFDDDVNEFVGSFAEVVSDDVGVLTVA